MTEAGRCPICGARLERAGRKTCSRACAKERKRRYQEEYQRQRCRAEKTARQQQETQPDGARAGMCRVCGQPVPRHRKKYCCDECYLTANGRMGQEWHEAIRRGEHLPQSRQGPRPPRRQAGAKRRCLKCDRMFPSQGPDNRLCPLCRQENNSWLNRGGCEDAIFAAALWE